MILPGLDLRSVLAQNIGTSGIRREALRAVMAQIRPIHGSLSVSVSVPVPLGCVEGAWAAGRPLVLLASPASWQAAVALVAALDAPPVLLDAADPQQLAVAVGLEGAVLVVVQGPGWVERLGQVLAPSFADAVTLAPGEAARWLLAAAGGSLASVDDALRAAAAGCREPAMADNPSYALAAAALAGGRGPLLLVPSARLLSWGRWLAAGWRTRAKQACQCALVADESLASVPGLVVLASGLRPHGAARTAGAPLAAWEAAGERAEARMAQCASLGRPAVRLTMPYADPAGLAAAAVVWLHAAGVVGRLGATGGAGDRVFVQE